MFHALFWSYTEIQGNVSQNQGMPTPKGSRGCHHEPPPCCWKAGDAPWGLHESKGQSTQKCWGTASPSGMGSQILVGSSRALGLFLALLSQSILISLASHDSLPPPDLARQPAAAITWPLCKPATELEADHFLISR